MAPGWATFENPLTIILLKPVTAPLYYWSMDKIHRRGMFEPSLES